MAHRLIKLDPNDPFRMARSNAMLQRLYGAGLVSSTQTMGLVDKMTASSFCRRRIGVVMVRMKMSETVREAVGLVEQGHVRVGPQVVTDPAFLVTRKMEDYLTWVDTSKIKRTVTKYNDKLDDYDLLN